MFYQWTNFEKEQFRKFMENERYEKIVREIERKEQLKVKPNLNDLWDNMGFWDCLKFGFIIGIIGGIIKN